MSEFNNAHSYFDPGWGGGGQGYFSKFSVARVQHMIQKWTQSDLQFSKNEASIRSKINDNRGQLDQKSRRKFIQNAWRLLNNVFCWKNRPTLRPSISGTKCDRDKPIFSAERGGQSEDDDTYNRDLVGSKISKTGVITTELPYHAQLWEYPPLALTLCKHGC